jgi:cytochrome bd-type quinol oxidase subunit 2
VLYQSRKYGERANMPRLWIPYLIVGLLLAAGLLVVGRVGERASAADKAFRIEAAIWAFLTGLLGLVLLLAWTTTQHVFWYRNENLLLLNPLALWLAVLAVMSLRRDRWTRPAAITAVLVAMLSAVALIVKGLPGEGFPQHNLPIILLFLPPHFALAFGLWRRTVLRPRAVVGAASPTR